MKILLIFTFIITGLFFFSCENDGEVIIKASLPVRTIGENINVDNHFNKDILPDFTNYYIPIKLLEQFDDNNVKVKLHVLTPNKQHKEIDITTPTSRIETITENKESKKILNIGFNTFLEEGKKRALLVQVGSPNKTKNDDVNPELMFTGADIIDIQKGKVYNAIELHPVVNISGKVYSYDNDSVNAKITVYPASMANDLGEEHFAFKLNRNTDSDGIFHLSSIYSIFQSKYTSKYKREYFNLVLTATQGDRMGFSIAGKEYQEMDNIKTQLDDMFYSCYKYYDMEGVENCLTSGLKLECDNTKNMFKAECFSYQSGNLLPGVNIINDIKIYSKEEASNGVVTSVSSPKFTKIHNNEEDNVYYGNFFITGFNLDKKFSQIKKTGGSSRKIIDGTIRIYYDVPDNDLLDEFYLEYVGPFTLYSIDKMIPALKNKNAQVLQNRLPFFKLKYFPKGLGDSVPVTYLPNFSELNLTDGFDIENSFLGVKDLKKLTNNFQIKRVEFTDNIKTGTFKSTCRTIYNTETTSKCDKDNN